ncbi:hypothetical protein [Undibacterium griseum]|uniref:Metal-dependent enzyme (Double-stranded beta helix superfamily) n=1 Tax=Undibacterium griseum TaxID=2762295 RepID=A0ABR6YMW0_9BURK|nr:hypothetical protein [Undibacterium griseum]MBC3885209.1 hypothetical protein [Undibacterium griseum]
MLNIPLFIDSCRRALALPRPAHAVEEILSAIVADPIAIEATLKVEELKPEESARYVFLHQSPDLTILQVSMASRLLSPPHNHLTWAVIGLYRGCENNVFYRREGGQLAETHRQNMAAPDVMMLAPDVIHSISNPLPQASYSIHVYGGSLANPARSLWNPFTLKEESFQVSVMQTIEREMMRRNAGLMDS